MVRKREAVNAAWAQVDVVLQRRSDLIPNLVETVKGFAAHEEKVFGDIAAARAAMMGAKTPQEKIAANGQTGFRAESFAGGCRKLSSVEVERELFASAG